MVGLREQQWMTDDWQSTEWLWKAVLMFVLYILMSVLCWTQWTDHIAVIYSRLPLEHIEQFIVIFVRSTLLKNKDWQTVKVFIFITQKCETKTIYQTLHKQIRTCKNLTVGGETSGIRDHIATHMLQRGKKTIIIRPRLCYCKHHDNPRFMS